ncbi:flagellar protein FliS [mine drainage metagenome]|uniref:Flagellar protein FliS n=1 Tax=mine drainage metagenome TaxID=410659 RepID=A0A1J5R9G0_9ZZZZ
MSLMNHTALNAYAKVQVDTSTEGASPHKLIDLLYEGAIFAVSNAKGHMQRKEIADKGKKISHAITIIDDGLKNSLDLEAGGDLAVNLRDLYEYMSQKLLLANRDNDVEALDEVARLLVDLRSAWAAIGEAKPVPAEPTAPTQAAIDAPKPVQAQPAMATARAYGRASGYGAEQLNERASHSFGSA